ncbi:MAG TPA: fluoride efflux transporter CrcB [Candidatus Binatia bacterium]|nr:fluoride efflux transporter CrcB [Candidatus Binatia bacterium]
MEYLVISLGGALGCNTRYLVSNWAAQRFGTTFPYGTFIINVSGSFFLGLFMAYLRDRGFIHPHYRLFFATGFAGGYTTFSTFMYESLRLVQDGSVLFGLLNMLGSMMVGLLGALVGFVLGGLV